MVGKPETTFELGGPQTQASARDLQRVMKGLTTTGSGRLKILKDAYDRGVFRDFRLIPSAVAAIDDPSSGIADFVAKNVLPQCGLAILRELRATFDPAGRGGHARRLALIYQLDPDGGRQLARQALRAGSNELKVMAISCLGSSPDDLPILLEHVKAKTKDIRAAALNALSRCESDDAVEALRIVLHNNSDLELAVDGLRTTRIPKLSKLVLDEATAQFGSLLIGTERDKTKLNKQVVRMGLLLECLQGCTDKSVQKFLLEAFGNRKKLTGHSGGKVIEQRLVALMASCSKKTQQALVDAHASLSADELALAFVAACRACKPADVYQHFSRYVATKITKKRDPAFAKREAIVDVIRRHREWSSEPERGPDLRSIGEFDYAKKLDPRWLELAVRMRNLELVQALAVPGHAGANKLLVEIFEYQMRRTGHITIPLASIVRVMVLVQHPDAADAVITVLNRDLHGFYVYFPDSIAELIPLLPKDSLPKFEALLAQVPDKCVSPLMEYVEQLRSKSRSPTRGGRQRT
jgi:hypothetical protein